MTRNLLVRTLSKHNWNVTHTATALGLHRTYVYELLKKYELKREP